MQPDVAVKNGKNFHCQTNGLRTLEKSINLSPSAMYSDLSKFSTSNKLVSHRNLNVHSGYESF